jgi:hypothetical protein
MSNSPIAFLILYFHVCDLRDWARDILHGRNAQASATEVYLQLSHILNQKKERKKEAAAFGVNLWICC